MMRMTGFVLLAAFAVSACGNGGGEGDSSAAAGNAGAVGAPGNATAGVPGAQAGVPAASPQHAPAAPGTPIAARPAATPALPLRPLTEEDLTSTTQMGCTCTFDGGNGTYLQAIGNELMVRTAAGRQVCPITDAQFQSLGKPDGDLACSGVRLSVRERGPKALHPESDSADGPATLSAVQGGASGTLEGSFGCAC